MLLPTRTSLKTAPATEPVTTAEAKNHLRVDTSADDSLIDALITMARQHVEDWTRRALITQTWEALLDRFPGEIWQKAAHEWHEWEAFANDETIWLPWPPLQSVNSVTYTDTEGASQTWSASSYQVDTKSQPGRIRPVHDEAYPSTRDETLNAVTIDFDAGYGSSASDVPKPLRQAILLLIGEMYERRELSIPGTIITEIPFSVQKLMHPYRVVIA